MGPGWMLSCFVDQIECSFRNGGLFFLCGVFLDIYCCSIWAAATADVSPLLQKHLYNVTHKLIDF